MPEFIYSNKHTCGYPNPEWQAIKFFSRNMDLIRRMINSIYEYEKMRDLAGSLTNRKYFFLKEDLCWVKKG